MVPFHLKPPTSGDAHGVQHVTREAPVLARPNETTGLQVAAGRSRSEEKTNKTAFAAFFSILPAGVSIDAVDAESPRSRAGGATSSAGGAARLDLNAQRSAR